MRLRSSHVAALFLAAGLSSSAVGAVLCRDQIGRSVSVPSPAKRIVSLAPSITEMLFALGSEEALVGVTDQCNYPPQAALKKRVGGFVNPNLEIIVSLRPDLVLATADGNRPDEVAALEEMGLSVYVIDTRSWPDTIEAIRRVGECAGAGDKAEELATYLDKERARIRAAVSTIRPLSVLMLVGENPLVGVGPNTFLHQLIEEAGGKNALAGSMVKYPLLNIEAILAADPDVIVVAAMSAGGSAWHPAGWNQLRAVRQGRVRRLSEDSILRPGPRLHQGLRLLAAAIHPELFPR